jgi:hypothetical protein
VSVAYESEDVGKILALLMEIMPELHELCGEPSPPFLMHGASLGGPA